MVEKVREEATVVVEGKLAEPDLQAEQEAAVVAKALPSIRQYVRVDYPANGRWGTGYVALRPEELTQALSNPETIVQVAPTVGGTGVVAAAWSTKGVTFTLPMGELKVVYIVAGASREEAWRQEQALWAHQRRQARTHQPRKRQKGGLSQ